MRTVTIGPNSKPIILVQLADAVSDACVHKVASVIIYTNSLTKYLLSLIGPNQKY